MDSDVQRIGKTNLLKERRLENVVFRQITISKLTKLSFARLQSDETQLGRPNTQFYR